MDSLYCLEACFVADSTLGDLPSSSSVGKTRVGGLDRDKPRTRLIMESAVSLSTARNGSNAPQLANPGQGVGLAIRLHIAAGRVRYSETASEALGEEDRELLWYGATPDGLRAMAALVALRDTVIKPLLAANLKTKPGPKP